MTRPIYEPLDKWLRGQFVTFGHTFSRPTPERLALWAAATVVLDGLRGDMLAHGEGDPLETPRAD